MQVTRTVQELPSFQRVMMRFNFVTDLRVDGHACFTFIKQQPEVVKLMLSAPAVRKNDMTQHCRNVESALLKMSFQQLAELRMRWLMHSALN